MTRIQDDEAGLSRIRRALDDGAAVVLPLPTPLPYAVVGRDAAAVNTAKARPADQPCGVAVADLASVAGALRIDAEQRDLAQWLMAEELINLLLPTIDDPPGWMAPATSKGRFAMMLGWLPTLRPLLDERHHLYISSANLTGGAVATTAASADQALGAELLVLDGDQLRDPTVPSASAAIIGLTSDGGMEVVRSGVQNAGDDDPAQFVAELRQRWSRRRQTPGSTAGDPSRW